MKRSNPPTPGSHGREQHQPERDPVPDAHRIETKKEKYCRFKKLGIKYIDYKDPDFLMRFVNEQGKLLPAASPAPP